MSILIPTPMWWRGRPITITIDDRSFPRHHHPSLHHPSPCTLTLNSIEIESLSSISTFRTRLYNNGRHFFNSNKQWVSCSETIVGLLLQRQQWKRRRRQPKPLLHGIIIHGHARTAIRNSTNRYPTIHIQEHYQEYGNFHARGCEINHWCCGN